METTAKSISKFIKPKREDNASNLRSMIGSYLFHWPLFILALALTVTLALIYASKINDVYTLSTKILIQNQNKTSDAESDKKLDALEATKAVEDEMEVLKSRPLVEKIVNDLQLWVTYEKVGKGEETGLYSKSPFTFISYNTQEITKGETFDVYIKNWDQYVIKRKSGETKTVRFANALTNKLGTWQLVQTPEFYKYVGATIRVTVQNPEDVIQDYSKEIKVKSISKLSSVVEIGLEDTNLQRGKDILNVLLSSYSQVSVEEKKESAEKALRFIDERLASLKQELSLIEQNFEGFRSSQGLTNVSSEADLYLQNIKTNDQQLNEVNVKLNVIEGIERFVAHPNSSGSPPPTVGISSPSLEALVSQLSGLQLKRDQLLATTPESNPDFESINLPIQSTKAAIKENILGIKTSLLNVRQQLESNNTRFDASIRKIPAQERQYLNIKRQQSSKESLYIYLLQKREAAALSYNSSFTNNRKVDFTFKKAEKKPLVFALALILGFAFPIGLIFARELLNNKVTRRGDIEIACAAPILAEIQLDLTGAKMLVNAKGHGSMAAEQLRTLKSNIEHFYPDSHSSRVAIFTSSLSGEGKSFIVTNLAMTFAVAGKKTIILEFDFKKPKIAKILNLKITPGLGDFLTNNTAISQIIQKSHHHPNLSVICAGTVDSGHAELLENNKIGLLIDQLKADYDQILIDSPPVFLVADAMILARLADLTVYMVRQGVTTKGHLNYLQSLIEEKKLPQIGVVFNGIQKGGKFGYYTNQDDSYYRHTHSYKARVRSFVYGFIKRF